MPKKSEPKNYGKVHGAKGEKGDVDMEDLVYNKNNSGLGSSGEQNSEGRGEICVINKP